MASREESCRRRPRKGNCKVSARGFAAAVGSFMDVTNISPESPRFHIRGKPDTEGSTSGNWTCEQITQASDELDYTTISEDSMSDTFTDDNNENYWREKQLKTKIRRRHSSESDSDSSCSTVNSDGCDEDENIVTDLSNIIIDSEQESVDSEDDSSSESAYLTTFSEPDSDAVGDGTSSEREREINRGEKVRSRLIRQLNFSDRSYSLQQCAICFELMVEDDPLMQLPCAHNFHVACIEPWIQKRQTCPICRETAE